MSLSFIYPYYLWLFLLVPMTIALALVGRRAATRFRQVSGLGLRVLLLTLLILALAGIQVRLPSKTLSAVFVLDGSDSISPEDQARGEELIRQALQAMPRGDKAAVVVFGENALVERLASEEQTLAKLTSVPVTTRTDIASALQLAMALLPGEGAKRMVLLSDGRENLSRAMEQAEIAASQEIQLEYVPLGENPSGTEVLIDSLEAPSDVHQGQDFDLTVVIQSSAPVNATLRVFADDQLFKTREVQLKAGINRFQIPVKGSEAGFKRFRAQILPDADNRLQNNEASTFTVIHGQPAVLIVEGTPDDGENLAQALTAAKMNVSTITPSQLPTSLPELAGYDAIVLANVPAAALPAEAMETLPAFVNDLGHGLLMIGGDQAFGAGGYLRTPIEKALPVNMDVKTRDLTPSLALIIAVDKSGSMGRCHCDNPDLNQSYTRTETGQPKVDIAKEAVMRAASALGQQDYLGVVTFDSQAHWALKVNPLVDNLALEQAIGSFQAQGQTNLVSGVDAAYKALEGVQARRKHIILMTDGWVNEGDLSELTQKMREEGITLSVVAAGEGSALYLQSLAQTGGGSYYPATDLLKVPDIFLKETVKSVGQYLIEEPFYPLQGMPSAVLQNLDTKALPGLFGYNGTTAKNTARVELYTPRGDPLLATWQYGLGRSAAWTSDLKGQWGKNWVSWENYPRFAAQLVNWLLPTPQVEGLSASVSLQENGAVIHLDAHDTSGQPLNFLTASARVIDPQLQSSEVKLEQVGSGQYEATTRASQPGTYLIRLGANQKDQSLGQMTMGLVVPYSPEYRADGADLGLLTQLARLTGGQALLEPAQAFLHNLPAVADSREIGHTLLLIAALLFPLDVALRRVMLSPQDWRKAVAWAKERMPAQATREHSAPQVFVNLFAARDRTRQRLENSVPPPGPIQGQAAPPPAAAPPPETKPESTPPPQTSEDSFARLREAKKRARR